MAVALNWVISNGGKLPWAGKLKADMEHFVEITKGGWVVMGRKTWESIPRKFKPLTSRKNVVLTRQGNNKWLGGFCEGTTNAEDVLHRFREATPYVMVAHDLRQALIEIEKVDPGAEVFIIGGAEVYAQALFLADRIFCTTVKSEFTGDAVFPKVQEDEWDLIDSQPYEADGKETKFDCEFQVYSRKGSVREPVVNPDNARNKTYREQLEVIQASGKCPFCPGGYTMEDPAEQAKMVYQNDSWIVKENTHALEGAKHHFVLIVKTHRLRISEMTSEEAIGFLDALAWIRKKYSPAGGEFYMREGDTSLTGATVKHLHAQYIIPNPGETIVVYFGPLPPGQ